MRVVIQRVSQASVLIREEIVSQIDTGLLVLLGIEDRDQPADAEWLAGKVVRMRIFPDPEGKMNASVQEAGGGILVVSQFTLHAQTKRGNRPSFIRAARPEQAIPLYHAFLRELERDLGKPVGAGEFGADMKVSLVNDGPVTIWMDSRERE